MRKVIKIGNAEICMNANAVIRMYYRSNFNRKMLTDLMECKKLLKLKDKLSGSSGEELFQGLTIDEIDTLDNLSENTLKMAWAMAYAENKEILPFEEWIESLGDFKIFDNWTLEVLELVMSTFC